MTESLERGYVHVYTGDGKGKTTAAIGLAIRAAGAGRHVYIGQFIKGQPYSEVVALQRFDDRITLRQFGRGCFIRDQPTDHDIHLAVSGLAEIRRVMLEARYSIIILDEASVAVTVGLFPVERLLELIAEKPPPIELVFTGRGASPRLIEQADLVTEMRDVKHYYAQGVPGRKGIER